MHNLWSWKINVKKGDTLLNSGVFINLRAVVYIGLHAIALGVGVRGLPKMPRIQASSGHPFNRLCAVYVNMQWKLKPAT